MKGVQPKLKTGYLVFIAAWALLAYCGLATLWAQGSLIVWRDADGKARFTDFFVHYNGGLLARDCLSSKINIYDPQVQARSQERISASIKPDRPFFLQQPPYSFALFMPLTFTSPAIAYLVWTVIGCLVLAAALRYLLTHTSLGKFGKSLATFSVLAAYPSWLSFAFGQTAFFNFGAIILSLACLQQSMPLAAGLAASLVLVKIQYAPAIFLLGFLRGGLKFIAGMALGGLALVLYSVLIVGWDNVIGWPQALFMGETSSAVTGVWPQHMQNLRGYITLICGPDHRELANIATFICFLGGLALISFLWWRIRSNGSVSAINAERQFKWAAALTLLIMTASSLHTHIYDYVLIACSCIWLWDLTEMNASKKAVVALRFLILCFPISSWFLASFLENFQEFYIQPATVWLLSVITLAGSIYWKEQTAQSQAPDDLTASS